MNNKQSKAIDLEITIIGCGISGIATAFQLIQKGYQVNLIDPNIHSKRQYTLQPTYCSYLVSSRETKSGIPDCFKRF